jgi:rhamnulokinase
VSATAGYLAIDLGAESGRALLGDFDGEKITLREVHRFPNIPVQLPDGLYWDALRIYAEIKDSLGQAGGARSIGVDSWGVDFGLLDRDGTLTSNPRHYRDSRTDGMMERVEQRVSRAEVYGSTGIQFMPINTLYQLLSMEGSPLLEAAETMLLIPDLMGYWLTGRKISEYTVASTTALYGLNGGWAEGLIEKLGIPPDIFPEVMEPGEQVGTLLPHVAEETGLDELPVVAVASHDTASAVVAVPARGESFAYISSGTWSLVGLETSEPVTSEAAMEQNFTNEGGFGGTNRFLKNVMGLWILQECRRTWARQGREYPYAELARLAEEAPPFGPLVDPDDPVFLAPGDMPARLTDYCRRTGQKPGEEPGEVARCVLESLALKYRFVLERAEETSGRAVEEVHVVGGGSRNELLCRLTAEACGRPVVAGPVEATALGNVMVQAHAAGEVGSLAQMREVVRRSAEPKTYEPGEEKSGWEEAYGRLCALVEGAEGG